MDHYSSRAYIWLDFTRILLAAIIPTEYYQPINLNNLQPASMLAVKTNKQKQFFWILSRSKDTITVLSADAVKIKLLFSSEASDEENGAIAVIFCVCPWSSKSFSPVWKIKTEEIKGKTWKIPIVTHDIGAKLLLRARTSRSLISQFHKQVWI